MKFNLEFWTKHISFYLNGKGFQHQMNPLDAPKLQGQGNGGPPDKGWCVNCHDIFLS